MCRVEGKTRMHTKGYKWIYNGELNSVLILFLKLHSCEKEKKEVISSLQ